MNGINEESFQELQEKAFELRHNDSDIDPNTALTVVAILQLIEVLKTWKSNF